jgi:hypothetical protein
MLSQLNKAAAWQYQFRMADYKIVQKLIKQVGSVMMHLIFIQEVPASNLGKGTRCLTKALSFVPGECQECCTLQQALITFHFFFQLITSFNTELTSPVDTTSLHNLSTFSASFRRIMEQAVLTFHICFSVSKPLPPLENCSSLHCIVSIGLMDEL